MTSHDARRAAPAPDCSYVGSALLSMLSRTFCRARIRSCIFAPRGMSGAAAQQSGACAAPTHAACALVLGVQKYSVVSEPYRRYERACSDPPRSSGDLVGDAPPVPGLAATGRGRGRGRGRGAVIKCPRCRRKSQACGPECIEGQRLRLAGAPVASEPLTGAAAATPAPLLPDSCVPVAPRPEPLPRKVVRTGELCPALRARAP